MQPTRTPIERACDAAGGQAQLARHLSITPAAVNQWCKGARQVPAEQCPAIEKFTRQQGTPVRCEELRPDVEWCVLREAAELIGSEGAPAVPAPAEVGATNVV